MPLQRNYRFVFKNELNDTIQPDQLKLNARRWKFDTAGAIQFESSETLIYNQTGSLVDNAFVAITGIDNSTSGFLGGSFMIRCEATGSSTTGDLICFYETSTDNGMQFDEEEDLTVGDNGRIVAILSLDTVGTGSKSFRI